MKVSGQSPFVFTHRDDLRTLPKKAYSCEVDLHGGFAVNDESGGGIYYGMPGSGIIRISDDLKEQEIIELPNGLNSVNFHGTKICTFDNKRRLVLPANNEEKVIVLSLDGKVDFVLSRPEFEEYKDQTVVYKPTDTAIIGNDVYIADGYGSNYITTADLTTQKWTSIFAGKTENPEMPGLFGTAHGLNPSLDGQYLSITDRPHSRLEHFTLEGEFKASFGIPTGSKPCGIDFIEWKGRSLALIGSLDDPNENRPAPIYILDAETYEVLSTIRPKEDLKIELADHIHNTVWYKYKNELYLICQAWNPGYYFVLQLVA